MNGVDPGEGECTGKRSYPGSLKHKIAITRIMKSAVAKDNR